MGFFISWTIMPLYMALIDEQTITGKIGGTSISVVPKLKLKTVELNTLSAI